MTSTSKGSLLWYPHYQHLLSLSPHCSVPAILYNAFPRTQEQQAEFHEETLSKFLSWRWIGDSAWGSHSGGNVRQYGQQCCTPVAEYGHVDEGSNVWQMVVADYCSPLQWIEFSSLFCWVASYSSSSTAWSFYQPSDQTFFHCKYFYHFKSHKMYWFCETICLLWGIWRLWCILFIHFKINLKALSWKLMEQRKKSVTICYQMIYFPPFSL